MPSIDVIVSYYNEGRAGHLRYMTLHCLAYLRKQPSDDLRVILVDGSPMEDDALATAVEGLNVEYMHTGRRLSLAECFNVGIRRGTNRAVVTLVNDVFIEAQQVRKLVDELRDDVACAFPYLTVEDYGTARTRKFPVPRRCFPTGLSFNVAAFDRQALEQVGLIPEEMSGCYDDIVLFLRLRERGRAIVLRNVGTVFHLGQQTLKTGKTSVDYEADERLFVQLYPQYWRRGRARRHTLAQCWTTRIVYWAAEQVPAGLAKRLGVRNWVWAVEPYLCAERGTVKAAVARLLTFVRPTT